MPSCTCSKIGGMAVWFFCVMFAKDERECVLLFNKDVAYAILRMIMV